MLGLHIQSQERANGTARSQRSECYVEVPATEGVAQTAGSSLLLISPRAKAEHPEKANFVETDGMKTCA